MHPEQSVYARTQRTEWITRIQPALERAKLKALIKASGKKLSRREIIELRAGHSKLHRETQELLAAILKKFGRI